MQKYFVEFLGTLFLVFIILATGNWMAIGSALAIAVLLGGPISGGSYNPAVTIALMSAGKLPSAEVIPYFIAEIAGALTAVQLVKLVKK
jgi:glycerol uptake facilitator-like aquaporin